MKQNDERKRENYYHDDVVVFVESRNRNRKKQNDIILKTQIYLIDKNKIIKTLIICLLLLYSKYICLIFIN